MPLPQNSSPNQTRKSLRLNPAKLLRSKWTAVTPLKREKHFIVTALIEPEAPGTEIDVITMEAVLTQRSFSMRWRELNDDSLWRQGWR